MNRDAPPSRNLPARPANTNRRPRDPPPPPQKVDREKTCPFLIRTFVHPNSHHNVSDFTPTSTPTRDEHQIYTWRDTTLSEILILLRDASPALRAPGPMRYSLRVVYYDTVRDVYASRDLGLLNARDLMPTEFQSESTEARPAMRKDKTLEECRFVVGDFLDVSFLIGAGQFGGNNVPSNAINGPEATGGAAGLGKLLMGIKGNAGLARSGGPSNGSSNNNGRNLPPHLNNSRGNDRRDDRDRGGPAPRVDIPVGGGYAAKLARLAAGEQPGRAPSGPRNGGGGAPGGRYGGRNNERVSDNAGGGAAGGWGRRNGPLAAQGGDLESRDNGRGFDSRDNRGPPRDFGGRDRDMRDSRPELPRRRRDSRSVSPGRGNNNSNNDRGRANSRSRSRSRSRSPARRKSPIRDSKDKEDKVDAAGDVAMG